MSLKRGSTKTKYRVEIEVEPILIIAIESTFIKHLDVHVISKVRALTEFLSQHSKRQTTNPNTIT